jgi:hypothetical protein
MVPAGPAEQGLHDWNAGTRAHSVSFVAMKQICSFLRAAPLNLSRVCLLPFDHGLNRILKNRNLMLYDIPENLKVNTELSVDERIAEAGYGFPVC